MNTHSNDEDLLEACTEPGVSISRYQVPVSDGVGLRIIDFLPPGDALEKPAIVFVAGWISMVTAWQEVLRIITPRFRTLYIETREKKSSSVDWTQGPDFSLSRMVRDLSDILAALVPPDRPFCLVGSSLGSTIILDYLGGRARSPLLTIAIAPNARFGIPRWVYPVLRLIPPASYGLVREPLKWYLRTFRIDSVREREQALKYERSLDGACPRRLKASAVTMKDYSLWPKLPAVSSRVIVVGAETDILHSVEEMTRMVALIPDAQLVMMASNRETHSEKAGRFIAEELERLPSSPAHGES